MQATYAAPGQRTRSRRVAGGCAAGRGSVESADASSEEPHPLCPHEAEAAMAARHDARVILEMVPPDMVDVVVRVLVDEESIECVASTRTLSRSAMSRRLSTFTSVVRRRYDAEVALAA